MLMTKRNSAMDGYPLAFVAAIWLFREKITTELLPMLRFKY